MSAFAYRTRQDFLAAVRQKFPQYVDWPDDHLYDEMIKKYPVYASQIRENFTIDDGQQLDTNAKNWRDAFSDYFSSKTRLWNEGAEIVIPGESDDPSFLRKVARTTIGSMFGTINAFVTGDIIDAARLWRDSRSVKKGVATQEQKENVMEAAADAARRTTVGYDTWNIALQLPEFFVSFYLGGVAMSAVGSKIAAKAGQTGTKVAAAKYIAAWGDDLAKATWTTGLKAGQKVTPAVAKQALKKGLPRLAKKAPVRAAFMPQITLEEGFRRMTPQFAVTRDEANDLTLAIVEDGENLFPAMMKAYGSTTIEAFTEELGETLPLIGKAWGKNWQIPFGASIMNRYAKIKPFLDPPALTRHLRNVGFNGVVAELFEERVGDVMRAATGLQDSWLPTPKQFLSEAIAFSIPGMTYNVGRVASGRVPLGTEMKNTELAIKGMTPEGVAMTREELRDHVSRIKQTLDEERTQPWYSAYGLSALEKMFGKKRGGTLENVFDRMTITGIREVYDTAETAEPGSGQGALENYIANAQGIYVAKSQEAKEEFKRAYDKGEAFAIRTKNFGNFGDLRFRTRFFAKPSAFKRSEFVELAKESNISSLTPVGQPVNLHTERLSVEEIQNSRVGDQVKKPVLDKLRTMFDLDSVAEAIEYFNIFEAAINNPAFQGEQPAHTLNMSIPTFFTGTEAEFEAAEIGYIMKRGLGWKYDQTEDGEAIYIVPVDAWNDSQGNIYFSPFAKQVSIVEDIVESVFKKNNAGRALNAEALEWDQALTARLPDAIREAEDAGDTQLAEDLRDLQALGTNTAGRFERFIKSFLYNRMGWKENADRYNKMFTAIGKLIPREDQRLDVYMNQTVGQSLIDSLAKERPEPVRGPIQERVAEAMQQGRAAEARAAIQEAEFEPTQQVIEALDMDMRTPANRQAVVDIIDEQVGNRINYALGEMRDRVSDLEGEEKAEAIKQMREGLRAKAKLIRIGNEFRQRYAAFPNRRIPQKFINEAKAEARKLKVTMDFLKNKYGTLPKTEARAPRGQYVLRKGRLEKVKLRPSQRKAIGKYVESAGRGLKLAAEAPPAIYVEEKRAKGIPPSAASVEERAEFEETLQPEVYGMEGAVGSGIVLDAEDIKTAIREEMYEPAVGPGRMAEPKSGITRAISRINDLHDMYLDMIDGNTDIKLTDVQVDLAQWFDEYINNMDEIPADRFANEVMDIAGLENMRKMVQAAPGISREDIVADLEDALRSIPMIVQRRAETYRTAGKGRTVKIGERELLAVSRAPRRVQDYEFRFEAPEVSTDGIAVNEETAEDIEESAVEDIEDLEKEGAPPESTVTGEQLQVMAVEPRKDVPWLDVIQDLIKNFDAMAPLNPNVPLVGQINRIAVTGMAGMVDTGNVVYEHVKKANPDAEIFTKFKKPGRKQTGIGWPMNMEQVMKSQPYQAYYRRVQTALYDPAVNAEGWIVVTDLTPQSLEYDMGYPMWMLLSGARTGVMPWGHATAKVETRKRPDGTTERIRTVDVNQRIAEADATFEGLDYSSVPEDSAFRAVLLLTSEDLLDIDEAGRGALQERIHDFIVRNRIRNLGIAGMDVKNAAETAVVVPAYQNVFQEALIGALEQTPAEAGVRALRGAVERVPGFEEAVPEEVAPETIAERPIEELREDIVALREALNRATDQRRRERLEAGIEAIEREILGRAGLERPSYAMRPPGTLERRMFEAIRRFHNNRRLSETDAENFTNMISRALAGDENAKEQVRNNLTAEDREAFAPLLRPRSVEPEVVEAEAIEPPNQAAVEQMELSLREDTEPEQHPQIGDGNTTAALGLADDVLTVTAPYLTLGAQGLHNALLKSVRGKKEQANYANTEILNIMRDVGLYRPKRGLPAGHAQRARNMLRAVTTMLEDPKGKPGRIPVSVTYSHTDENGRRVFNVESEAAQPYIDEWNENKPADMPTAGELRDRIRGFYDRIFQGANAELADITDSAWMDYLDNYVNHWFQNKSMTPEELEVARNRLKEDAREAKKRKYPTYMDAAQYGLLPVTMDVTELMGQYSRNIWSTVLAKSFLTTAALVNDVDGKPVFIPTPRSLAPGEDSAISMETYRRAARNLATYADMDFNESADPVMELNRIIKAFQTGKVMKPVLDADGNMQVNAKGEPIMRPVTLEQLGYTEVIPAVRTSVDSYWVQEGPNARIMAQILDLPRSGRLVNAIEGYNAWSKTMTLLFSGFHPFSLLESAIAIAGIKRIGQLALPGNMVRTWRTLREINRDLKEHPEHMGRWIRYGSTIMTSNPNILERGTTRVDSTLKKWFENVTVQDPAFVRARAKAVETFFNFKKGWDNFLWNEMHPTLKLASMDFLWKEYTSKFEREGRQYNEEAVREDIAKAVNDAFGGQEWESYMWATPKVRQMLHLLFFAPDWTLSAANIAGATSLPGFNRLIQHNIGPIQKDVMLRKYWPAMATIVLFAIPNAIQAAIYGAFGDDDEDDVPFTFMNEEGKKSHIDFTPLLRNLPGYVGGDTGKRRVYMRWGKQAYEVFEGWYQDFAGTALRKTSSFFRTAFEQATGSTTSGWDLPFKDAGYMGLLVADDSIFDSRASYVARKFMPYWFLNILEGRPVSFIAPVSRGATQGMVIDRMREVFEAYANPSLWNRISGNTGLEEDLASLVPGLIEAAEKNGVDPELALRKARSFARGKYYRKFFKAINNQDEQAMEEAAESVVRLNASIENFEQAIERRFEATPRLYTNEIQEQINDSFDRARQKLGTNL